MLRTLCMIARATQAYVHGIKGKFVCGEFRVKHKHLVCQTVRGSSFGLDERRSKGHGSASMKICRARCSYTLPLIASPVVSYYNRTARPPAVYRWLYPPVSP